jgi:hypothetical protein
MKPSVTILLICLLLSSLMGKEVEDFENPVIGAVASRPKRKSMPKAMMYSLMLPGWGDFYAGNRGTGKLLLGTEITIWIGYLGFQYYGNIQKDAYMLFAHQYAGANTGRSDELYFDAVEVYRSSSEYNSYVYEDARLLYPSDPAKQNQYVQENGYFGIDGWEWQENEPFREYRKMRIATRETYQRAVFMTGFAILNRLVAAITSSRNVRNHNKRIEEMKWGIHLKPQGVGFTYRF